MQDDETIPGSRPEVIEAAKRTLEENAELYRRLAAGSTQEPSAYEAPSLRLNANTTPPMRPRTKYTWIIFLLIAISLAIVALMLLEYISIPIGLVLLFSLDPVILITAVMMNAENEK